MSRDGDVPVDRVFDLGNLHCRCFCCYSKKPHGCLHWPHETRDRPCWRCTASLIDPGSKFFFILMSSFLFSLPVVKKIRCCLLSRAPAKNFVNVKIWLSFVFLISDMNCGRALPIQTSVEDGITFCLRKGKKSFHFPFFVSMTRKESNCLSKTSNVPFYALKRSELSRRIKPSATLGRISRIHRKSSFWPFHSCSI